MNLADRFVLCCSRTSTTSSSPHLLCGVWSLDRRKQNSRLHQGRINFYPLGIGGGVGIVITNRFLELHIRRRYLTRSKHCGKAQPVAKVWLKLWDGMTFKLRNFPDHDHIVYGQGHAAHSPMGSGPQFDLHSWNKGGSALGWSGRGEGLGHFPASVGMEKIFQNGKKESLQFRKRTLRLRSPF